MAETGTNGQMMNPGHAGKAIASVSLSKALNPPQTSGYIGCTGQLPVMDVTGVKKDQTCSVSLPFSLILVLNFLICSI